MRIKNLIYLILFIAANTALAASVTVNMYKTAPVDRGKFIGTVKAQDSQYGLLITPRLKNLTPGMHGFHVHKNASCADSGKAAGGHLDPAKTGKHLGPYNANGHLGDLPALCVKENGTDDQPILAPRLTVAKIKNHTLMIHAGGDNYADYPKKLGGGGARIACGTVK